MKIQVNTDNHTAGGAELIQQVEFVIDDALSRFSDRITRIEVHLSDENSSQKFGDRDKRCVMEARLSGFQPITVSYLGSSIDLVLAGAAETLEKKLKRILGRKDSLFKRRVRARAEYTAVDPLLELGASSGNKEEFLTLLSPLLDHLRDHARRELRILEINELLPLNQVTDADLLNEAMARAWQRFAGRPRQVSLDLWLVNLLDETLDEMVKPELRIKKSLYNPADEMDTEDVPQVDDQEWWVWLLGEDETITIGDTISRGESASSAEQVEARELKSYIFALLGALPKPRRQAFMLHVLEDYELFEIAMLQDRDESEVQADIEDVRSTVREHLSAVVRSHIQAPTTVAASTPKT